MIFLYKLCQTQMLVSCKAKVALSSIEQADKCWRTIHDKG